MPTAPVADMHWQQHHFLAPAPEEEPPLPAAPPKAAAATTATRATTATIATAATTPSQQPTAHSRQAQQHWRGPSDFIVIYVICLCCQKDKGTRDVLARSPANLDHVAHRIIPQCKLHASALMVMSRTCKTLKTDRGPPYLLMAYSPNKQFRP